MEEGWLRLISGIGLFCMIGIAWLASSHRDRFPWRIVACGLTLQIGLAVLLIMTPFGNLFFRVVAIGVEKLLAYTKAGTSFIFGPLLSTGFSFALEVLPIIIFMGSIFAILYHLGWMQWVVNGLAYFLARIMKISGAESLAAVANVFVGMVESSLVVRPYLANMTRSELFTLMTLGMATVAGSVLLAYVSVLGGGAFAGHLLTASILSAPAGIVLAKVMIPETETPATLTGSSASIERKTVNIIDAAAEGAISGLKLAVYVGAMLIAFIALIEVANDLTAWLGSLFGFQNLNLQKILGLLMAPIALLMGVPWQDAPAVGSLIGVKTIFNEFIAFQELGQKIDAGLLTERSRIIASYALCGFANFGSLAILLGGISGLAPSRRQEVASLGLRSILAGSLATFMTACVAGMLI